MLLDIQEEHLEEVEILWSRRRGAVWSPDMDLKGLEELEERLRAHLDGLALGIGRTRDTMEGALCGRDPDSVFAAAAVLLMTGKTPSLQPVVDALGTAPRSGVPGIVDALCHLPLADTTRRVLEARFEARELPVRAAAIEVLGFHRSLPSTSLASAVCASDPEMRKVAARAIGRVGGEAAWIERLAGDEDPRVRDMALETAARRGLPWALEGARSACRDTRRVSAGSLRLLACVGDRSDIGLIADCVRRPGLGEAALAGLATLGYVECVGAVLEFASDARFCRGAGWAFLRITGLETPIRHDGPGAPGIEDESFEDESFEDLRSVPDPEATCALWRDRAGAFDPRMRWRNGKPLATERWRVAPNSGDLLTRREEFTRLWAREPGLFPHLELDAPAARQRAAVRQEGPRWRSAKS